MNLSEDNKLESQVSSALKGLGDLPAPAMLLPRVLHAIEQRAARPWYQRGWVAWPASMQVTSAAVLLVAAGMMCWGAMHLFQTPQFGAAVEQGNRFVGLWQTGWRVVELLKESLVLIVRQLSPGVLAMAICVFVIAWVAFAGLGTVYVRLAMRPAVNRD